jgi:hypothetical protein
MRFRSRRLAAPSTSTTPSSFQDSEAADIGLARGEFADQFLDDVFQRHQALDLAIFIHHQAHALAIFAEELQLGVDRCRGGNEIGLGHAFAQRGVVDLAGEGFGQQPLLVQDADDVGRVVLVHGDPGVEAGRQLLLDVLDRRGDVDGLDFAARRHDVGHRQLLEFEQVEQDGAVLLGNEIARFQHQRAQFLGAEPGVLVARLGLQAQQARAGLDEQVDEPDDGIGGSQQGPGCRPSTRQPIGVGGAEPPSA